MGKSIKLTKTGVILKSGEWALVPDSYRNHLCQVCPGEEKLTALYDARTPSGRWGYLCATHFASLGCRLGTGFGQRLVLESEKYEVIAS